MSVRKVKNSVKKIFSKPEKFGFASQPSALDLTYLSSSQPALDVRSTKAEYYKKLAAETREA